MPTRLPRRLPVVGVMGSASRAHEERAAPLGAWLAGQSVHLLTGGGGGVMSAVSRAFAAVDDRRGLVLGIVPGGAGAQPPAGYPNPWVEICIATHLPKSGAEGTDPLSRNHLNVLSSDVLVALPGSLGTRSEVELALRYGKPIAAFLAAREDIPELPGGVPVFERLEEVQEFVRGALAACDRSG